MADGSALTAAAIDPLHYQEFRRFLEQSCGIVLGDNKQYLVASRLSPLMGEFGFGHLGELVARLALPSSGSLRGRVIEAMTTNETQFFRDVYPFQLLKKELFPRLLRRRPSPLRLWSAGCSSGQEAYSISMMVQEFNDEVGWLELEILGTDISPAMVQLAAEGRYNGSAIGRGLTPPRLQRYFQETPGGGWQVRPEIRRRTSFRQHNLLENFSVLGRFDIIFCRNVLIYFSHASRRDILGRMAAQLNAGGYLVVGGSESLTRQTEDFQMIRATGGAVYRLKDPV